VAFFAVEAEGDDDAVSAAMQLAGAVVGGSR